LVREVFGQHAIMRGESASALGTLLAVLRSDSSSR
jgi:hypothetical protein